MKILFLSRWFPYPTNNGSKLRIYNLLSGLSQSHEVTLLSFLDQTGGNPEAPELQSLCSRVQVVPWKEFNSRSLRALAGFLSPKPRSIIGSFSTEMAGRLSQTLKDRSYDLVIASQLSMAAYQPYFQGLPALFEELELGLNSRTPFQESGWRQRLRYAFTWFKFREYLSRLLMSFCAVTVVSNQERELVLKYFPDVQNISVIPNSLRLANYTNNFRAPHPNRVIFAGSFRYRANYEAMVWFVGQVFPRILERLPETQLIITGDHMNLPLPSKQNVTLAGHVDDIKGLVASSTVAIAPLRRGGGTRLKILEAMALGTPVVATSKGAEGLDVQSSEQIFVADNPVEFSNCVINLLREKDLRQKMAQRAKRFVQEKYDWEKNLPLFLQFVESVVPERDSMRHARP